MLSIREPNIPLLIERCLREAVREGPVICVACGVPMADGSRFCPMCGSPAGRSLAPREARKNVTALFIDIVGSTTLAEQLDPESLRQVLDRYFAACVSAITEHGGEVEKFIGDAVLAVFGAIVTHENDAIRAVRAAAGCHAQLEVINAEIAESHGVTLAARCGVCSGEVIVITSPDGDFRVIGDAINTASRLQSAAQPGEILIGEQTAAMVRGYAAIEQVPELQLKGKAAPVPAWRVTTAVLAQDEVSSAPGVPLIGREDELEELRRILRRVVQRNQVCLVTVLGAPGMGKTRLVREFLATIADGEATVMSGRCSSYGKGITYAPLANMLSAFPGGRPKLTEMLSADTPVGARAIRSLTAVTGEPFDLPPSQIQAGRADPSGISAGQTAFSRAGAVSGTSEFGAGNQEGVEEISWAIRYLLEMLGQEKPVIMVWDDLHWAEQTLLDLIDDAATWLVDVPVLLVCIGRTELLENRPGWGGGKSCATTLELGPLTYEQSATLVSELAMRADVYAQELQETATRVALECDGNPLFAELMLEVVAEAAPGTQIPPTIHALLSARLDQLPDDQRQLVEMAAVIGREFSSRTLAAIASEDGIGTTEPLNQLLRRRVVQRTGGDGFRFRQALLRDTAYALASKARRERWHKFLARWVHDSWPGEAASPDQDEHLLFAYHVEAARLLRRDLAPGDTSLPPLAQPAADALIAEGERALKRKDLSAAATLLERGRALMDPGDARSIAVTLHVCDAWLGLRDADRSMAALCAAESAPGADKRTRAACAVQRYIVTLRAEPDSAEAVEAEAERIAMDLRDNAGDDLAWCRYHQLQAYLHLAREKAAAASASFRQALTYAQAIGDLYEEERISCAMCEIAQWTLTPVSECLELCAALSRRFAANRALLVPILVTEAYTSALAGLFEEARRALSTARECADDLHLDLADAAVLEVSGIVESLAGAHDKAETLFRRAASALRAAPRAPAASIADAAAARELFLGGRTGEAAAAVARLVDRQGGRTNLRTRIAVTTLRGRIASATGCHDQAVSLVTEAREMCSSVDDPRIAGEVHFDMAIVLQAAGFTGKAASAASQALEVFAAKGAALLASRVQDWLSCIAAENT